MWYLGFSCAVKYCHTVTAISAIFTAVAIFCKPHLIHPPHCLKSHMLKTIQLFFFFLSAPIIEDISVLWAQHGPHVPINVCIITLLGWMPAMECQRERRVCGVNGGPAAMFFFFPLGPCSRLILTWLSGGHAVE